MKKLAFILVFIFGAFIVTPSIVACIDRSVDISFAYDANEEETSKPQANLEFNLNDLHSNLESIRFLKEQKNPGHYYEENYCPVYPDVTSPPPRHL